MVTAGYQETLYSRRRIRAADRRGERGESPLTKRDAPVGNGYAHALGASQLAPGIRQLSDRNIAVSRSSAACSNDVHTVGFGCLRMLAPEFYPPSQEHRQMRPAIILLTLGVGSDQDAVAAVSGVPCSRPRLAGRAEAVGARRCERHSSAFHHALVIIIEVAMAFVLFVVPASSSTARA